MEAQNHDTEKICPCCHTIFYGDVCPQCGWVHGATKCPNCGTYFKEDTCPQCGWEQGTTKCPNCGTYFKGKVCPQCFIKEKREIELRKRKELLNELKSVKYCKRHKNYYLGEACPKCVEQDAALAQKEKYLGYVKSIKLCEKCGSFYVGDHCNYCCEDNEASVKPLLPLTFSKICPQCGTLYKKGPCPTCSKNAESSEDGINKVAYQKPESKEKESQTSNNAGETVIEQNSGTSLIFVVYCFFSVVLFLLFLLPVMKIYLLGNELTSYNLYEYIKVFSKYNLEWSNARKTILGCCIATLVLTCGCVLISIVSIVKAITNKRINKPNIMIFILIAFAIISIIMIVNINALNDTAKNAFNDFNMDMNGNVKIGGNNTPLKDVYKVGAFPIVLLVTSIILFFIHCFTPSNDD